MTVDAGDLAVLVALVIAGPWGLVIVVALIRGYDLRVLLTRRARAERKRLRAEDEDHHRQ